MLMARPSAQAAAEADSFRSSCIASVYLASWTSSCLQVQAASGEAGEVAGEGCAKRGSVYHGCVL
jgi:hypothetical protein